MSLGGLDGTALALLVAGAALAGLVQGIAGFAFGMVSTSVWVWGLEPRLVAVMAVWGSLIGQVVGFFSLRRALHWHTLWPFLAGGLLGMPLGVAILPGMDILSFKRFLGGLLVLSTPLMLWQARLPRLHGASAPMRSGDFAAGLAGGVMGGLGGFSGVVPTLWCTLRGFEKDRARAVIQNFLLAAHTSTLIGYSLSGTIRPSMLPLMPVVAAALLLPSLVGARLYRGLSDQGFRRMVLLLLFASGCVMLATTVKA